MKRVNKLITIVLLLLCCSCGTGEVKTAVSTDTTLVTAISTDTAASATYADTSEYAMMYAVVADTGHDYYPLQQMMYSLSEKTHIPVDTMNRYYNKEKNEIVLNENDEDEMYRGEYYPRRSESGTLSLEYYHIYCDASSADRNIALISGVYENSKSADSMLTIVKPYAPHAFVKPARMYMGCMH